MHAYIISASHTLACIDPQPRIPVDSRGFQQVTQNATRWYLNGTQQAYNNSHTLTKVYIDLYNTLEATWKLLGTCSQNTPTVIPVNTDPR